jgi:hypothetical protein
MEKQIENILIKVDEGTMPVQQALNELLLLFSVSKRKFAVEWMRNVNYGIGSGTEYFNAETREEALKLFWNGKNKEAFEINTIYVC